MGMTHVTKYLILPDIAYVTLTTGLHTFTLKETLFMAANNYIFIFFSPNLGFPIPVDRLKSLKDIMTKYIFPSSVTSGNVHSRCFT